MMHALAIPCINQQAKLEMPREMPVELRLVTDGQTDGATDGQTMTACTALA